jgi:hypothetical protein
MPKRRRGLRSPRRLKRMLRWAINRQSRAAYVVILSFPTFVGAVLATVAVFVAHPKKGRTAMAVLRAARRGGGVGVDVRGGRAASSAPVLEAAACVGRLGLGDALFSAPLCRRRIHRRTCLPNVNEILVQQLRTDEREFFELLIFGDRRAPLDRETQGADAGSGVWTNFHRARK